MKRFMTAVGALALALAACTGGASPAATPASATPRPVATPAPATPTPAATRVKIASAVTWDGQKCTYAGPAAVPLMSTVEFKMTNTSATDFTSLYVGPVQAGTSWDEIVAWAKSPDTVEATFFLDDEDLHMLTPGEAESTPLTAVITRNLPYVVLCSRDPAQAGGGVMAPAALLSVLKG